MLSGMAFFAFRSCTPLGKMSIWGLAEAEFDHVVSPRQDYAGRCPAHHLDGARRTPLCGGADTPEAIELPPEDAVWGWHPELPHLCTLSPASGAAACAPQERASVEGGVVRGGNGESATLWGCAFLHAVLYGQLKAFLRECCDKLSRRRKMSI